IAKLLVRGKARMVGNVVGGADEIVVGKNQRPVARMDDPRRHRKVLVAVSLAGSQFGCGGHRELATNRFQGVFHIGEDAAKTNAVSALSAAGQRAITARGS